MEVFAVLPSILARESFCELIETMRIFHMLAAIAHFVCAAFWAVVTLYVTHVFIHALIFSRGLYVFLFATYLLPACSICVMMFVLGLAGLRAREKFSKAIFISHSILLTLGIFAAIVGIYALRAAQFSTLRGGGIMSPVTVLPLVFSLSVLVPAVLTFMCALLRRRKVKT